MNNLNALQHSPVWYAGSNQSDFQAFGGWTKPAMKTMDREQPCNVTVSTLYRPR